MTDRVARSSRAFALLAVAAGLAVTTQAEATTHHHHHATNTHERRTRHGHATSSRHAAPRHGESRTTKPAAPKPAGAASVPAGGLKVFCPAGRNPLMVRKMTQGNGTTVTVVCR